MLTATAAHAALLNNPRRHEIGEVLVRRAMPITLALMPFADMRAADGLARCRWVPGR